MPRHAALRARRLTVLVAAATIAAFVALPGLANASSGPDLGVTLSADHTANNTNPATAGDSVTFIATVTNVGDEANNGYTLTLAVPSGTTTGGSVDTTGSTNSPSCNGTAPITCSTTGDLQGTEFDTYKFSLGIDSNFTNGDTLSESASLSAATPTDPTDANDTTSADVLVDTSADMEVTSHSSSPLGGIDNALYAGNEVTYTIDVTNIGPSDAQNVHVTEALTGPVSTPDPVLSISHCVFVSEGDCSGPEDFDSGDDASLGALGAGSDATVLFSATVKASFLQDGNSITASATAASEVGDDAVTPDPNTENNTLGTTTTVNTLADITVEQSGDPAGGSSDMLIAGNVVTYHATVTNDGGPSDAQNVQVTEDLQTADLVTTSVKSCIAVDPGDCVDAGDFSAYTSGASISLGRWLQATRLMSISEDR